MTMGRLAIHLAELPGWAIFTIDKDELDIAPAGAPPYQPPKVNSRKELLALFDKNAAATRPVIAGATDAHLLKPWSLLAAGKTIFTLPRFTVLRGTVMNHIVHHRAQLGVFLRLNNVPLPAIYGPSADEGGM
jgi:predicted membrane-bound mannosyltransferase